MRDAHTSTNGHEMIGVDRHPMDRGHARRLADEAEEVFLRGDLPRLTATPALQTTMGNAVETVVFWLSADDPRAVGERMITAATSTVDLYAGMYLAAAVVPEEPLPVTVNGAPMTFHGNGIHFDIALDTWMPVYWWYRLSRSEQSRSAVTILTKEQILRDGRWAKHRVHMYDAFIALEHDEPKWIDHIHLALDTVGRPAPTDGMEAQYLHKPLLHMLIAIADDDQTAFTDALAGGLETHQKYWTRTEKFATEPAGYTSIPLAAICGLAVDRGLTIDVESDYLPTGLITPGWYR